MVDPKNRSLRPPIQRSWLRLRLGKAYYAARRYALWRSPRYRWAKERRQDSLPYLQASHETPLLRHLRGEDMELQRNKVVNLRLAVEKLDGVLLRPGETLSYWQLIGKPSARRGYLPGMVLFLGRIGSDVGGGLCQLSNLIFWMTLHTDLTVVERYRHSHRDLMIRNDTRETYQLRLRVGEENLEGEWLATAPPLHRFEIQERDARMDQAAWGGYVRHNAIWRRVFDRDGRFLEDQPLFTNDAIMMYSPLLPEVEE